MSLQSHSWAYIQGKTWPKRYMHPSAHCSTVYNSQDMDKEDVVCIYIYTHTHTHTYINAMEYYSAIKKNEIMPPAATWMDLASVILMEGSQSEKEKYHRTSLIRRI